MHAPLAYMAVGRPDKNLEREFWLSLYAGELPPCEVWDDPHTETSYYIYEDPHATSPLCDKLLVVLNDVTYVHELYTVPGHATQRLVEEYMQRNGGKL